jgi:hypothetical protein
VVLFDSWASDLIAGDYNATTDVFWGLSQVVGRPSSLVAGVETIQDGGVRILWRAVTGLQYAVQFKHDLAVEEAGSGESVFDVEPDSLEPEEVPSLRTPLPEAEPVDEEDRRFAHLEKRMEELSEAKDRLERQVSAQTEELRVQRAAIARTQRVLRSIAPKGAEEPSEPLVRG